MKRVKILTMLLFLLACVNFTACSDDDGEESGGNIPESLYGTWYGEVQTQQTGNYRRISLTFNANGTGQFTYSSSAYYRVAEFRFSMSGAVITCNGVIAGEDGVANKFKLQFEYHGSYITPVGAYSEFTLTK